MTERVVVVGASVAGVQVVQTLRARGWTGEIVLLDAEPGLPYDKPPLSKAFLYDADAATVPLVTAAQLAAWDVDFRPGVAAAALDLPGARVTDDAGQVIGFDHLVLATGSVPRRLAALDRLAGVHYLRTRDDATALRHELARAGRAVVVGGGFIGAEVAASARRRGLDVVVVEAAERLAGRVLPAPAAERLRGLHEARGVDVRLGSGVRAARAGSGARRRVEEVELSDGTSVTTDLVVVGVGTRPAVDWLETSGLPVDDGVRCDPHLQVEGSEQVWAVGDVARWYNPRFAREMRVEHWTSAREQATTVAAAITGTRRSPCTLVPYVWSDQYDAHIQHVGVGAEDSDEVVERHGAGSVFEIRRAGRLVGATGFDAQHTMLQLRRELAATPYPTSSPADWHASMSTLR